MLRLSVALLLVLGCRPEMVDHMSRVTELASHQYAEAYISAHAECLKLPTREEYDACMEPWNAGEDSIQALRQVTLALDAADKRPAFRSAACRWHEALRVVEATSPIPLPAIAVGLDSRWRRKCK